APTPQATRTRRDMSQIEKTLNKPNASTHLITRHHSTATSKACACVSRLVRQNGSASEFITKNRPNSAS
ncbi:MAG: hypothetical protein CTY39_06870, partial [Hyphomicrobium sp.]